MRNWSWTLVGVGAILLGFGTATWAQTLETQVVEEEDISPPVLLLPSAMEREGQEVELEFRPDRWKGKTKAVKASDTLSVSAVRRLGSRGQTFARWRHQNGSDIVEAGLECSLFGRDHWKVSHKLEPTSETVNDSTKLSLGVDVGEAAKLSLSRTSTPVFTEVGSGVSYKTEAGFEWGAKLKARRLTMGEEGWLWRYPAIESSLRWTW